MMKGIIMRKLITAIVLCFTLGSTSFAQDPSFGGGYMAKSFVVDASIGFLSNQVDEFKITTQPMISSTMLFSINPKFYAGIGLGLGVWNYDNNEGRIQMEKTSVVTIPLFADVRYAFSESKKYNLFLDAKLGYRFGPEQVLDMLTPARTGEDFRYVNGNGFYSAFMMGFLIRKIELGVGVSFQNVNYDVYENTVVISSSYPYFREENVSKNMRSFFVKAGYWF